MIKLLKENLQQAQFHISRSSLLPEYRSSSSGSAIPSNNYNNDNPSSYSSILEGRTCIQSQYRHNDYFSLSGSETEKPLLSADYKTKISSTDWKPSVPFRPSFFIPPAILSSVGSQTIVPESNGDISSASFHGASNENVLENDCHTPGKDPHTAGAEAVETSLDDGQNGTMPKGDEPSVSTHAKAISKSKTCVGRHQNDGSRHKKDIKVDRVRQNNEMDLEHLVKELLKPAWSEGHLSKDAYKTIVKKAVDKVLSTLQPHQIPTTIESAKQYLYSSQPKIAKLVEGYADKYGKS
ncbi:hypothetical protein Q3G72_022344 [Acer saccharum]|nr:hypothetical protein Q3G72_022344 [Acer saccharum]